MSRLLQICTIFVVILYCTDIAKGIPIFQGFSIHRGFEVNLKPFEFKPITFFKEKWSPFGIFGFRKGIQKRDLGAISGARPIAPPVVSPAPVFEKIEELKMGERIQNIEAPSRELRLGPNPVQPLPSNLIRVPLTENSKPPTGGLYTNIGHNPSANNFILEKPAQIALEEMYGELPPRPVGPIPAQPVQYVPVQQVMQTPVQPPVPKEVIPLIIPPTRPSVAVAPNVPLSEIPPTESPLVKGSKLALYFSNVFLQLVSQFLTNARLQFSQFSSQQAPPPAPVQISN